MDKGRVALLPLLAPCGLRPRRMDYRDGAMGAAFIHAPLLVFHEAGHVTFAISGEWVRVLGGTLGQPLMPAILAPISLFDPVNRLHQAQRIGAITHVPGVAKGLLRSPGAPAGCGRRGAGWPDGVPVERRRP